MSVLFLFCFLCTFAGKLWEVTIPVSIMGPCLIRVIKQDLMERTDNTILVIETIQTSVRYVALKTMNKMVKSQTNVFFLGLHNQDFAEGCVRHFFIIYFTNRKTTKQKILKVIQQKYCQRSQQIESKIFYHFFVLSERFHLSISR